MPGTGTERPNPARVSHGGERSGRGFQCERGLMHAWPGTLLVKDGTHAAHERFFETACALSPEERSGLKDWCAPFLSPSLLA